MLKLRKDENNEPGKMKKREPDLWELLAPFCRDGNIGTPDAFYSYGYVT